MMDEMDRNETAQHILEHVGQFKCCEVCQAIIPKESGICPQCYAYRFTEDEEIVRDRVVDIAARPAQAVPRDHQYRD